MLIFNKEKSVKLFYYFLVFTLSKSAVFIAPLLLSNYLDVVSYAKLEYGISIGNILSMVVGMGVSAVYPIIILNDKKIYFFGSFILYVIGVFLIALLLVILSVLFPSIQTNIYSWAILMCFIFVTQSFYSTIYKTHSWQLIAVFLDSGFYIFLLLIIFLVKFTSILSFINLFNSLLFYFVSLSLFLIFIFRHRIKITKENLEYLKIIIIKGYPLVISSFLIMTLTNSGRILIERFCTKVDLAEYSFYFRLASMIMLFHQFAAIMFFKKLFTSNSKKIDKYFTLFLFLLLSLNIIAYIIIPILGKGYLKLLSNYYLYKELYFLLVILVVFWSMTALHESLIYRENLAGKMNIKFSLLMLLSIIVLIAISNFKHLVVIDFVKAHLTMLFLCLQVQIQLLKKKNFYLPKLQIASIILFVLTFIIDNVFF